MFLYNTNEAREADRRAIEEIGIPGSVLMENAGIRATERIVEHYSPRTVCIMTGPGNNGGDGYVIARQLHSLGVKVRIISSRNPEDIKGDSLLNYGVARKLGIIVEDSSLCSDEHISECIQKSDLLLDCLLGTGSSGPPRGEIRRLIVLGQGKHPVVAIDIPSGIDPDNGKINDPAITADMTLTMIVPKTGLYVMPASSRAGKVEVLSIGVNTASLLTSVPKVFTEDKETVIANLPARPAEMHKGDRGGVMILGGSSFYKGATALSALGALSAGSGFVFSAGDRDVSVSLGVLLPEVISVDLPHDSDNSYLECAMNYVKQWKNKTGTILFGPGTGRSLVKSRLLDLLFDKWEKSLVIDGDGLYWLRSRNISRQACSTVITPHEGEAAGLLGIEPEQVRSNRLQCARDLALKWGVCVLKGSVTIVDNGNRTAVISEGSQSLSVPGSGDVLAGVISSLCAGGLTPFDAACSGAWIHARAGKVLEKNKGYDGVLAREIAAEIPHIIKVLRKSEERYS